MPQAHVVIRGGRAIADGQQTGPQTRGQDIGIFIRDKDGKEHPLPGVRNLVLRCDGRRAVVTCEIEVDDVDITCAWIEAIERAPFDADPTEH